MRFLCSVFSLLVPLVLTSCGGAYTKSATAKLQPTISPATQSTKQGSTLRLTGTATGLVRDVSVFGNWYMLEATATPQNRGYCGVNTNAQAPPVADCPGGYVSFNTKSLGLPSVAVYHAPQIPGTYHPVFEVLEGNGYILVASKTITAEITVTP